MKTDDVKDVAANFAMGLLFFAAAISLAVGVLQLIDHHYIIAAVIAAPVVLWSIYHIGETLRD